MTLKRVNVDGLMKLAAFSHAVVAGDFIYVSGECEQFDLIKDAPTASYR